MSLSQDTEVTFEPILFEPFEETVETAIIDGNPLPQANLSHSDFISYPAIKVTFDGTEYICDGVRTGQQAIGYGGITPAGSPDFTNYPLEDQMTNWVRKPKN